ncbi:MAG: hypothetical protein AAFR28_07435, partial [Pseudomonadota bacterium]
NGRIIGHDNGGVSLVVHKFAEAIHLDLPCLNRRTREQQNGQNAQHRSIGPAWFGRSQRIVADHFTLDV